MERKVGETFELDGKQYLVIPDSQISCNKCAFNAHSAEDEHNECGYFRNIRGNCALSLRFKYRDNVCFQLIKQKEKKEKKMKRTVIKYKVLDNIVLITDIQEAQSYTNIKDEFGDALARRYCQGTPSYRLCLTPSKKANGVFITGEIIDWHMKKQSEYSREEFNQIITTMKAAGTRLQKIVKAYRTNEEKEILI